MASVSPPVSVVRPSSFVRWARLGFVLIGSLMVFSVFLQVFYAGAGILVHPRYFDTHRSFAHIIEGIPLLLLIVGFLARLPRRILGGALFMFLLIALQYVFLYAMPTLGFPVLRGLHAVNALVIFWVSLSMAREAWRVRSL